MLSGETRITGPVLLFDEIGDHPAAVTADVISRAGHEVHFVTPDRILLHDLGPTASAVALRDLSQNGVRFTCLHEVAAIASTDGRKEVSLRNVLTGETRKETVHHVVFETAVQPMDELYHALKPQSKNLGQMDHSALMEGSDPFRTHNPGGGFFLARIGDAVASRNMHAALLDALRACARFSET